MKISIAFIGESLSHSIVPKVYATIASIAGMDIDVQNFQSSRIDFQKVLTDVIKKHTFACITFPHKVAAATLVNQLTERANEAGSINIAYQNEQNVLVGDNTDGQGFINDLNKRLNVDLTDKNILILGSGGVARGILAKIHQYKPKQVFVCSRKLVDKSFFTSDKTTINMCTYDDIPSNNYDIIINATSASIYNTLPPNINRLKNENAFYYECAYKFKDNTNFSNYLSSENIKRYSDGIGMLIEQAIEAINIFHNCTINPNIIYQMLMDNN